MARRAAGHPGPLHSAQDPAPRDRDPAGTADGADAPGPAGEAGPEDLERLRASLLHGRSAGAAPLRVEDPVHLPPGPGDDRADRWADRWDDGWADPDALAGGESAVMHPDDLAALHALPTTTAETRAWAGDGARAEHLAGREARQRGSERLVAAAADLSLWEDDRSWTDDRSWDEDPSWDDGRSAGLLRRRWVQLALCALVALVVGASLALLVTGRQVDAARAEAERQGRAAASAQADLVRERAARASEEPGATAPPPAPAAPLDDPSAPSTDPAAVVPLPPGDQQRPPVLDGPAPTADPGPPPPGPSPSAPAQGRTSPAPSPARSSPDDAVRDDAARDDGAQDDGAQDDGATSSDGQGCSAVDGTGGDGATTCP